MNAKQRTLTDQLRDAIQNAEVSRYRLCADTGITQSSLSRFMHGKAGLSAESIDLLGEYLDLEIRPRRAAPKRPKKGRQ